MSKHPLATTLDDLWNSVPPCNQSFDSARLAARSVPEPARRYLEHAISSGTPLASAVRLRMHGEFRQKRWYPFTAEQVIRTDGEMLWCATIRIHGLPVEGFDRVIGGKGTMQWKTLGFLPLVNASGPDITRSALGRIAGESVWLPSLLCDENVLWTETNPTHAHAPLMLLGEPTELAFVVADTGRVESVQYPRWGNPESGEFHYTTFGGIFDEEGTFGGYTIPTHLRVGWYFGTPRFESEGEFFRVTIDEAAFR